MYLLELLTYKCSSEVLRWMEYTDFLDTDLGNRAWRICPCKDSSPEWEASSFNFKAGFALLAYLGADI